MAPETIIAMEISYRAAGRVVMTSQTRRTGRREGRRIMTAVFRCSRIVSGSVFGVMAGNTAGITVRTDCSCNISFKRGTGIAGGFSTLGKTMTCSTCGIMLFQNSCPCSHGARDCRDMTGSTLMIWSNTGLRYINCIVVGYLVVRGMMAVIGKCPGIMTGCTIATADRNCSEAAAWDGRRFAGTVNVMAVCTEAMHIIAGCSVNQ